MMAQTAEERERYEARIKAQRDESSLRLWAERQRDEGIAQGIEKGLEKGREDGAIQELRKTLRRLGERRFGALESADAARLEAINELARLERMAERILDVNAWDELLATP